MSTELMLHGTHLPYQHLEHEENIGIEGLHIWTVTGPTSALVFQAACVHVPLTLTMAVTDEHGNNWLPSDMSYHTMHKAANPQKPCSWLSGQPCRFSNYTIGHVDRVMKRALESGDRNLFIRRYLTAELEALEDLRTQPRDRSQVWGTPR